MDIRQNPLWLSVPLPSLFRTEIRISVWFFILAIIFCLNLGLQLGIVVSGLLLISVLVHEIAHVLVARKTGGTAHEILIWPLGGLAFPSSAPSFSSEVWTILSGPLVNGIICLCCLPYAMSVQLVPECLALLDLPPVSFSREPLESACLLLFSINFKLMIVNLCLPIFPLDCSQLVYAVSKIYWDRQTARIGSLWVGMVSGILLMLVGMFMRSFDLLFLSSVLLIFCQYEFIVAQVSRSFDDSFMGYDFSQGYTSLERDDDREARRPGLIERWKRDRAEKKREKDQLQKIETERRLDELLEKVHQQGMASLTAEERRFLQKASSRYKSPGKD